MELLFLHCHRPFFHLLVGGKPIKRKPFAFYPMGTCVPDPDLSWTMWGLPGKSQTRRTTLMKAFSWVCWTTGGGASWSRLWTYEFPKLSVCARLLQGVMITWTSVIMVRLLIWNILSLQLGFCWVSTALSLATRVLWTICLCCCSKFQQILQPSPHFAFRVILQLLFHHSLLPEQTGTSSPPLFCSFLKATFNVLVAVQLKPLSWKLHHYDPKSFHGTRGWGLMGISGNIQSLWTVPAL